MSSRGRANCSPRVDEDELFLDNSETSGILNESVFSPQSAPLTALPPPGPATPSWDVMFRDRPQVQNCAASRWLQVRSTPPSPSETHGVASRARPSLPRSGKDASP